MAPLLSPIPLVLPGVLAFPLLPETGKLSCARISTMNKQPKIKNPQTTDHESLKFGATDRKL
jgi:hypothetical protein